MSHVEAPWGTLTWYAELGNSGDMTVGRCVIRPGAANPLHSHPNCSEVLVVMQGRIAHTADRGTTVISPKLGRRRIGPFRVTLYNKGLFLLGYFGEIAEFCGSIMEERPPPKGRLAHARQVTRVFEAFFEGEGREISLA